MIISQNSALPAEALTEYVQIFKYGAPPHGGFAIGLERLTQKLCNIKKREGGFTLSSRSNAGQRHNKHSNATKYLDT